MFDILALLFVLGFTAIAIGVVLYALSLLRAEPVKLKERIRRITHALHLTRHEENPLLSPEHHAWEGQGVINPAAVRVDGKTHLFYRAIGADGISRVGYASSEDGRAFAKLPYPVFALSEEGADAVRRAQTMENHAGLVASGGSWAGVEDPRAVVIDDRLYLTFSAFGGWDSLRMGVTSLTLEDLRARRWKWTPPTYLSPRGQVHKNWVLFPERIGGKFAMLHSMHGDSHASVRVDYLDTLDREPETPFRSADPNALPDNPHAWHKRVRGAGPPPIKTPLGWLLLYHATDHHEPNRYKLGALLLDEQDPRQVKFRSAGPILSPDASYENEGAKAGVVYACGATVEGDVLTVFYGAADSVVCAARHSLWGLLALLTTPSRAPRAYSLPRLA